jgi:hypothetical protein
MTPRWPGDGRGPLSYGNGKEYPLWAQLMRDFGFPIVVALVLLGMLTGYVASPISRSEEMLKTHMVGEGDRTRIIRIMCRHQAMAQNMNPDDCDR